MTAKTYVGALDAVLIPEGFERTKRNEWVRTTDGFLDQVDTQTGMELGITANVWVRDLACEALLEAALPPNNVGVGYSKVLRINELSGKRDGWWRRDPNGPAEMAEDVRLHALPYFERMRSLDYQLERCGRGVFTRGVGPRRFHRAMTLFRIGELEEAIQSLEAVSQFTPQNWLDARAALLNWLERQRAA